MFTQPHARGLPSISSTLSLTRNFPSTKLPTYTATTHCPTFHIPQPLNSSALPLIHFFQYLQASQTLSEVNLDMAANFPTTIYQEVRAWLAHQEAYEAEHKQPAPLSEAQRLALLVLCPPAQAPPPAPLASTPATKPVPVSESAPSLVPAPVPAAPTPLFNYVGLLQGEPSPLSLPANLYQTRQINDRPQKPFKRSTPHPKSPGPKKQTASSRAAPPAASAV